jgi:hypothetical protein
MKRFDKIVNNVYASILTEQQPPVPAADPNAQQPGLPQTGGPTAPVPQAPPPVEPPKQSQPITPEGKIFLIDYIRKALAVDPGSLSADEKAVFNDAEINSENAESILDQLKQIIDSHQ